MKSFVPLLHPSSLRPHPCCSSGKRILKASLPCSTLPPCAPIILAASDMRMRCHVRGSALKSGYEFCYCLALVLWPLALLHALAQERGIEFETIQLIL